MTMSDINLTDQPNQAGRNGVDRPHIRAERADRPTVGQQLEQSFGMGAVQTEERRVQPPLPPQPPLGRAQQASTARQPQFEPKQPVQHAKRRADPAPMPAPGAGGAIDAEPPIVYSERRVIDDKGNALGRVSDVIFEGTDPKPTWMVVKPGLFRAARYVPVRGSYATVTNKLVVPFSQRAISSSPRASGSHVLTSRERALLSQHYKLDVD